MYKLINDPITKNLNCIQRINDNTFIPLDFDNTDYKVYLAWVAEGNTPEPADE